MASEDLTWIIRGFVDKVAAGTKLTHKDLTILDGTAISDVSEAMLIVAIEETAKMRARSGTGGG